MNRKKFILSNGAVCDNWTWSWSFVNHNEKFIIFGAWDTNTKENGALIFSEKWQRKRNGSKRSAYPQSREHIRLIEEEGYSLKVFRIIFSDEKQNMDGEGPSTIKGFERVLTDKLLRKVEGDWYAVDDLNLSAPDEVDPSLKYIEGAVFQVLINGYERNLEARKKCLDHYGFKCSVCAFDFEEEYGVLGKRYIHVHHLIPLAEIAQEYEVDPIKDLRPLCPNCHAMIHRLGVVRTIEELQEIRQAARG
ncbi:5-methylcytosine-specific restriction protein A [Herbaspirillum sp. 1173]|uniref:HNH endonuclease n=1 Tax=Herbaspirillum sp. 1173 TaxID=2817734 RepID=UPI00286493B5|nr:HNH endonuclease [Herbaspirillum sp. 1173]MDR6742034.1 5-methylcytosine-specific restriction protein A [Herbaspirillum sp. 1173]